MFNNLYLRSILLLLAVVLVLAGCGSSSDNYDSGHSSIQSADSMSNLSLAESVTATLSGDATATNTTSETNSPQQKLIYKGDLNIETKAYDNTMDVLLRSLEQANGYIVSQEDANTQHSRYTTIEIRIPSAHFFSWVEGVEQLEDVSLSKHIFTEDVSEEYVDLVARLEAKQVVIDKYLEYMQLATTADELIRFTNELASLQEEIEAVQARIRYLDHQVDYSILTLYVKEMKEQAFFSELRVGSTLKGSIENGVTGFVGVVGFLISTFIVLLPFIIIGFIVWLLIYVLRRNTVKNKVNPYSTQAPIVNSEQQANQTQAPPQHVPPQQTPPQHTQNKDKL